MRITKKLINNKKARPGYSMKPEYVTIHNTRNFNKGADALAHQRYFQGVKSPVSAHYIVDDNQIVQIIPDNEVAWHAGDGSKGTGNRKSIAIEACENKDANSDKVYENTIWLAAHLLKKYNLGINRLKRHKDWSGKNCPALYIPIWNKFVADVKREMEGKGMIYYKQGDKGTGVKELQQNLTKLGFDKYMKPYGADGSFGPATKKAVLAFQKKYKLSVDGYAGPKTLGKIKELLNKSGEKLYKVQVGAFKNKKNAEKLLKELESKGYKGFIKTD